MLKQILIADDEELKLLYDNLNDFELLLNEFSKQDRMDMEGLMNQASFAFIRILMYEEVERLRKLNQNIIDTVNEGIQFVSIMSNI